MRPASVQLLLCDFNRLGIDFQKPEPSHHPIGSGLEPEYTTVGDAIMDLVGKENQVPNHVPLMHKPIVAARYGYVKEGEDDVRYRWIDRIFPVITTTDRLSCIDKVGEDCIRFVATGRKTNAKYRMTYKDIKKLGFTPLVHSYYHRFEEEEIS